MWPWQWVNNATNPAKRIRSAEWNLIYLQPHRNCMELQKKQHSHSSRAFRTRVAVDNTSCSCSKKCSMVFFLKGWAHNYVTWQCVKNIKIAGKWMFITLKMVLIGIDPYPHHHSFLLPSYSCAAQYWKPSIATGGRHDQHIPAPPRNMAPGIRWTKPSIIQSSSRLASCLGRWTWRVYHHIFCSWVLMRQCWEWMNECLGWNLETGISIQLHADQHPT